MKPNHFIVFCMLFTAACSARPADTPTALPPTATVTAAPHPTEAASGTATPTLHAPPEFVLSDEIQVGNGLAWSPDGTKLAVIDYHGLITILDVQTHEMLDTYQEPSGIDGSDSSQVAFSPDGQYIAGGTIDSMVTVWDITTGQRVRRLRGAGGYGITGIEWSPDGSLLAAVGARLIIWDIETQERLFVDQYGFGGSADLAFSPDSQLMASGTSDGMVYIWDRTTNTIQQSIRTSSEQAHSFEFSPDGAKLAIGVELSWLTQSDLRIWDLENETWLSPINAMPYGTRITSLKWSPDGRFIATTGYSLTDSPSAATVRIWDMSTYDLVYETNRSFYNLSALDWSSDGRYIAFVDWDGVYALDALAILDGLSITNTTQPATPITLSIPEARPTPTLSAAPLTAFAYSFYGPTPLYGAPPPDVIALSDNQSLLWVSISPSQDYLALSARPGDLYVYQLDPFRVAWERHDEDVVANGFFWAPDVWPYDWLITTFARCDGMYCPSTGEGAIWDYETGDFIVSLDEPAAITSVDFSTDGSLWLSAGRGGFINVRAVEGDLVPKTFSLPTGGYFDSHGIDSTNAAINVDSSLVAAIYEAGGGDAVAPGARLNIWSLYSDDIAHEMDIYGATAEIAWSPVDPNLLALGTYSSGEVVVVDAHNGAEINRMLLHGEKNSVGWSPDGQYVYGRDDRGWLAFWDAASWEEHFVQERVITDPIWAGDKNLFATIELSYYPENALRTILWDAESLDEITRIDAFRMWAFTSDRSHVIGWDQVTNQIVRIDLTTLERQPAAQP